MRKDNDFIYDAIAHFEQLTEMSAQIEAGSEEYEALLTIGNVSFIVFGKPEIRTSNWGIVMSELNESRQKSHKPILIIARYLSTNIAKKLKEQKINYLDGAGNSYINEKRFFIFISGQKLSKNRRVNQSRAFQKAGIKLIFVLLTKSGNLQLSYRHLSKEAGIAIGSVSNIINELEQLNFVLTTKTKRVLKNKTELLNRWVTAYNDTLVPHILKKRMRFSCKKDYEGWDSIPLQSNVKTNLWGGEPAASILTGQLQPERFIIYTNDTWQNIASNLKLIPDENGDIEIRSMFWEKDSLLKNKKISPPLLVYADLISSGFDRNIQIAKTILTNEIQHIK